MFQNYLKWKIYLFVYMISVQDVKALSLHKKILKYLKFIFSKKFFPISRGNFRIPTLDHFHFFWKSLDRLKVTSNSRLMVETLFDFTFPLRRLRFDPAVVPRVGPSRFSYPTLSGTLEVLHVPTLPSHSTTTYPGSQTPFPGPFKPPSFVSSYKHSTVVIYWFR